MNRKEIRERIQHLRDDFKFNEDLNKKEINVLLTEYKKCHESKFHYDTLSWQIGSVLVVAALALVSYSTTIKSLEYFHQLATRLIITSFAILLLVSWKTIHRRYAGFAEVANERIRNIERKLGICGIGIEFELSHFEVKEIHSIFLPNTEATKIFGKNMAREETFPAKSEHKIVGCLIWTVSVLSIVLCFIP